MPKAILESEWIKVVAELQGESDRAVAIVGGALIETVIEQAITCRLLHPMSETHRNKVSKVAQNFRSGFKRNKKAKGGR